MSPCLDDLVRDPARAGLLSSEERQALLAQVVALLFALGAPAGGNRLLTATEAADKLGCAPHTLYRNKRHPARVQNGRSVRFSERTIEAFIRQHSNSERTRHIMLA
jgi:predicted DNA-binding transcriptional regulator AlpA